MNSDVLAIIPARAGSKAIKNKNIVELEGFPLIAYSIAVAKMSKYINRVVVSTNSSKFARISESYGAEVPFLRPEEISRDDSLDTEFLYFTLQSLLEREGYLPQVVALLRPTTPIRNHRYVDEAIELLLNDHNCSAVVSVTPADECPYKWMILEEGNLISPFPDMAPDDVGLPRQSFPRVLIPDGYIDVLRPKMILDEKKAYGNMAIPYYTPEKTIDIDTMLDLKKAKEMGLVDSEIYQWLLKTRKMER